MEQAMLRLCSFKCVLAAIISVLCVANAKAVPITYTETAAISGSLNGVSFADKLLTLTGTGDTAAVAPASGIGFSGFTNPITVTFSVAGTGSGSLIGSYHVFDNHIAGSAGFTNDTTQHFLLFIFGPAAFDSYALSTSIGPFTDDAEWNPGVSFPSTAGALIIQTVLNEEGTFTAAVGEVVPSVPVPGTLPLFATGLGALGLLGWRRKRKQVA
jgi:PEP-CTERM motif